MDLPSRNGGVRRLLPRLLLCLGLGGLALLPGGCGRPAAGPGAALEIREPRASLMPGMGVAYLTVVNPGPEDDRLLSVETAAALRAETHESLERDGVMRMVPRPEGFAVPAAGTLELRPGGKHIMLVEPRMPAGGAATIPLTLHFERGGTVEVQAAITAMGAEREDGGGGDR